MAIAIFLAIIFVTIASVTCVYTSPGVIRIHEVSSCSCSWDYFNSHDFNKIYEGWKCPDCGYETRVTSVTDKPGYTVKEMSCKRIDYKCDSRFTYFVFPNHVIRINLRCHELGLPRPPLPGHNPMSEFR